MGQYKIQAYIRYTSKLLSDDTKLCISADNDMIDEFKTRISSGFPMVLH